MGRSGASDTRFLLAGVAAFLALAAYLAVAFVNTHTSSASVQTPSVENPFAPFVSSNSKLVGVPRRRGGRFAFRVTPAGVGYYGALVPTLVSQPQPGTFVFGIWLRGARPGRIGIEIDEFRSAGRSPKLVNTTVPATIKWHHFSFTRRVKGEWLGLGMFVSRRTATLAAGKWFAVRDLRVTLGRR